MITPTDPAFPVPSGAPELGVDIRTWLAANAPPAPPQVVAANLVDGLPNPAAYAKWVVDYADALIEALNA